mmetsp:Transcript_2005/g.9063  ORF Transcript_2005/g.9063 Transcript_2005/m.9063 type:complete len:201 (-) Transcript_2005:128-730(-)
MRFSEEPPERVVRGHTPVVPARVLRPVPCPFMSVTKQRVHVRRRFLLLEQPRDVRGYPFVPLLLGDVRRHLFLGHDRAIVTVDGVLGLGFGLAALGVGVAHHVPGSGFVPDALPVSLGPRPDGLDGALAVLSQAGSLGPPGLLEHAESDVVRPDLRGRLRPAPGLAREHGGSAMGRWGGAGAHAVDRARHPAPTTGSSVP